MSMEKTDDPVLEGVRSELQKTIVKSIMDDERNKPVIEELGGGSGVFATHKVKFHKHELYANSEEDAKYAEAAIMALNLTLAIKTACDLTGERME